MFLVLCLLSFLFLIFIFIFYFLIRFRLSSTERPFIGEEIPDFLKRISRKRLGGR